MRYRTRLPEQLLNYNRQQIWHLKYLKEELKNLFFKYLIYENVNK